MINIVNDLPRHPTKKYVTRDIKDLKYIAVHHSGTVEGTPKSFAEYHIKKNDWPGIGYHYVITKQGVVYKTNNITTISYHVGDYNRQSIGICLVGNFDLEKPTEEQYKALAELIKELQIYNLEIKGHKDFANRTCPGKNFDFLYLGKLLAKEKSKHELLIEELEALIKKYKED